MEPVISGLLQAHSGHIAFAHISVIPLRIGLGGSHLAISVLFHTVDFEGKNMFKQYIYCSSYCILGFIEGCNKGRKTE